MKVREVQVVGPYELLDNYYLSEQLGPNDILVEVIACGLCATEYPVYKGQTVGKPGVSFRYAEYPCSIGHEVSGIVVDIGSAVEKFDCGDRVTGIAYSRSGFATHVIENQSLWRKVPKLVPLEQALGEPLLCVQNIINRSEIMPGFSVVIIGDGFMSIALVAALRANYNVSIYLVGHYDDRLSLCKKYGADYCINSRKEDPYWIIRKIEDQKISYNQDGPWKNGVDVVIDMTGSMSALQLGASLVKPKQRKKLVMAGFYREEAFTIGHYLINRGPDLVVATPSQSENSIDDLDQVIKDLGNNVYPMNELITHVWSLDEIDIAIKVALGREDGFIKGIIAPNTSKLENPESYKYGSR